MHTLINTTLLASMEKIFVQEYERLYKKEDSREMKWVKQFVEHIKEPAFKILITLFNDYRMDVITSDREAAAFMSMLEIIGKRNFQSI